MEDVDSVDRNNGVVQLMAVRGLCRRMIDDDDGMDVYDEAKNILARCTGID